MRARQVKIQILGPKLLASFATKVIPKARQHESQPTLRNVDSH